MDRDVMIVIHEDCFWLSETLLVWHEELYWAIYDLCKNEEGCHEPLPVSYLED